MNVAAINRFITGHHRLLFYSCWFLLGLLQSGLTELLDDEAYYWVFSRYPDWGYYDHPPLIALLVKAGTVVFPGELGVRLVPLLLNTGTLLVTEKLTERKDPFLFYGIALSIAVIQIAGIFAVPDTPLIFFTALFFLTYKQFSARPSWINMIGLGITVSLLLYSKYHGILIVFFTGLSNLRLLRHYRAWLAAGLALLLYTPHLWWQYQHDWVSFRYHLFESNVNPYKLSFTIEYLLGQILLAGPLAGIILLPAALLYRPVTGAERALRFTLIGIYLFFFFSSFRGRVEANWTAPALVPLMVLSHRFLADKLNSRKWLFRLLPVTLLLVLAGRIILVIHLLPVKAIRTQYHAWEKWPGNMTRITGGLPVVFNNSYQWASKYWFYTGQPAYSHNLYRQRKNNYNYWPLEDSLLGKPVYYLDRYGDYSFPAFLQTPAGRIGYRFDSCFVSFAKIQIKTDEAAYRISGGADTITARCRFEMPAHYRAFILDHRITDDTVRIGIFKNRKWVKDVITGLTLREMAETGEKQVRLVPGLAPGKYEMRFAINCGYRKPTHNSGLIPLRVD